MTTIEPSPTNAGAYRVVLTDHRGLMLKVANGLTLHQAQEVAAQWATR